MSRKTKKIIAIGGGEIGRKGYQIETTAIDKEILRLSAKKHPRLLFIPTASKDSQIYIDAAKNYFERRLGCKVDTLLLVKQRMPAVLIRKKINQADVIYVGGGNTLKMMQIWRSTKLKKILNDAYAQGKVLSGLSAGAICWFRYGLSDSRLFSKNSKNKNYMRVKGLDFIPLTISPHHIREKKRKNGLIKLMRRTSGVAVALDDFCALEVLDDKFRIISSKMYAGAHKVYMRGGKIHYEPLSKSNSFQHLSVLFKK